MDGTSIHRLQANVDRCRRLAERATDSEVARVLRETAADIEAAIPILEDHVRRALSNTTGSH